eukprot:scaffold494_cov245-Pinguiococcus_pyrenoidosus.AAC.10
MAEDAGEELEGSPHQQSYTGTIRRERTLVRSSGSPAAGVSIPPSQRVSLRQRAVRHSVFDELEEEGAPYASPSSPIREGDFRVRIHSAGRACNDAPFSSAPSWFSTSIPPKVSRSGPSSTATKIVTVSSDSSSAIAWYSTPTLSAATCLPWYASWLSPK